jgi:hypothetical protein
VLRDAAFQVTSVVSSKFVNSLQVLVLYPRLQISHSHYWLAETTSFLLSDDAFAMMTAMDAVSANGYSCNRTGKYGTPSVT